MTPDDDPGAAADPRRLFVYNGGLLARGRVRRILELAGWDVRTGKPGDGDFVGVWGASPTSGRGEWVADKTDRPLVRVEDAFLRSLHPGRHGDPPLGLLIDRAGVHFDSSRPSDLETLLATHRLDDTALLDRARAGMWAMQRHHLSKYTAVDPLLEPPDPGFVLVIDQTRDDASIAGGGSSSTTFREMMVFAQTEHRDAEIVVKAHPETVAGHRPGHFDADTLPDQARLLTDPVSAWRLFEHARAVYTVSSGLGFDAIMAGHRPRVFGQPFYGGWGLTADENPVARRERKLTRAQLFAGAMILAPVWYDPYRDKLTSFEGALNALAVMTRQWREDRAGWVAGGISRWKRPHMRRFFGRHGGIEFATAQDAVDRAAGTGRRAMVWARHADPGMDLSAAQAGTTATRVEDGILRSAGLGARLVPPLSLVTDDLGVYYDPTRASRLEEMIAASVDLPKAALERAERLAAAIVSGGLSKYGPTGPAPISGDWPSGPRVLVVGQVADDASVTLGCGGKWKTNEDLLRAARQGVPNGCIVYKPHPDVLAGLRAGAVPDDVLAECADVVLGPADPHATLTEVEAVWTLTSTLGFEALMRGLPVTCLGAPFYAGWGLTRDFGPLPGRRTAEVSLAGLLHAVLIDYPRYVDPVTGLPCPPEVAVDRLTNGLKVTPGALARLWAIWHRIRPRV